MKLSISSVSRSTATTTESVTKNHVAATQVRRSSREDGYVLLCDFTLTSNTVVLTIYQRTNKGNRSLYKADAVLAFAFFFFLRT